MTVDETRTLTVTCRTAGCGNADIDIVLQVPVDPPDLPVYCGVCGELISERG